VTAAVPFTPSLVAVIVAGPTTRPVTSPLPLTDATLSALLAQVMVRPVSTLPAASLRVAVNCAPRAMLAGRGRPLRDGGMVPPEPAALIGCCGDDEHRRRHAELGEVRPRVLEDAVVPVVEGERRDAAQRAPGAQPLDEFSQGDDRVPPSEPVDLLCEALERHVDAGVSGCGRVARRQHVMVAEKNARGAQPPHERGDTEGHEAAIACRAEHEHCRCGAQHTVEQASCLVQPGGP